MVIKRWMRLCCPSVRLYFSGQRVIFIHLDWAQCPTMCIKYPLFGRSWQVKFWGKGSGVLGFKGSRIYSDIHKPGFRDRSEFGGLARWNLNSKHEIRNPKQYWMTKIQMIQTRKVPDIADINLFLSFEFVSNFKFYQRYLRKSCPPGLDQNRILIGRIFTRIGAVSGRQFQW